jgi:hypothetical protein
MMTFCTVADAIDTGDKDMIIDGDDTIQKKAERIENIRQWGSCFIEKPI